MKRFGVVLAGVMVLCLSTLAQGQDKADNKTKILGKWEVVKGDAPPGATIEFTKDGKLIMLATVKDKEFKMEGTYKIDGDKIMSVLNFGGKEQKETITIKKLTDKELITLDEKGKTDEFKKK